MTKKTKVSRVRLTTDVRAGVTPPPTCSAHTAAPHGPAHVTAAGHGDVSLNGNNTCGRGGW